MLQRSKMMLGGSRRAMSMRIVGNAEIDAWIDEVATRTQAKNVRLVDGSEAENSELLADLMRNGTLTKLNEEKRPNSYLARSSPSDVARVESQTFICSASEPQAGPTNNWCDAKEMQQRLNSLFTGSMSGRTLYVVPFSMGPVGSPYSRTGIQLTDSAYVVASMRIMTRMGADALQHLLENDADTFVRCEHSVGAPLAEGESDVPWPCSDDKWIVHYPEQRKIVSFGSGYGGNALLGKKCFALRIASAIGREEGWLAEHMLILGLTSPAGVKKYVAAAFPSACGKTNLAMMQPSLDGWKVETVGDDIAWMHPAPNGGLCAINPENGFFGVAPGTSWSSNPHAMSSMHANTLFTNTALTDDGDVWWEGMTDEEPEHLIDWRGEHWTPGCGREAAHPNARFTAPISQCPVTDPQWEDEAGVPISAILFGGRRASTVPLVYQARSWQHGTFMGASVASEQTAAAAESTVGALRHDPFAMLPFCGYNMGDYMAHWLDVPRRSTDPAALPKIFFVNWFRKNAAGDFMWPGFGDNSRVLKWIFERADQPAAEAPNAVETPIGFVPSAGAIDVDGLDLDANAMRELVRVEPDAWRSEVSAMRQYFSQFGTSLPAEIAAQCDELEQRVIQK